MSNDNFKFMYEFMRTYGNKLEIDRATLQATINLKSSVKLVVGANLFALSIN